MNKQLTPDEQSELDKLPPEYQLAFKKRLAYMNPIVEEIWKYARIDKEMEGLKRRTADKVYTYTS